MKIHIPIWERVWKQSGSSREETAEAYRLSQPPGPFEIHTPWETPALDAQDDLLAERKAA